MKGTRVLAFGMPLLAYALLVRAVFVWSMGERFYDPAVLSLMPVTTALAHGQWPEGGLGPAPMVPLLLAAGQWLVADHFRIAARALLAAVGIATVVLGAMFASIHPERCTRTRALLLAACSPMLVLACGSFSAPGAGTMMLLAAAVAAERSARAPSAPRTWLALTLAVATALVNPLTWLPLAALAAWLGVMRWGERRAASFVAFTLAVLALSFAFAPVDWLGQRREASEARVIASAVQRFGPAEVPALTGTTSPELPAPRRLLAATIKFAFPPFERTRDMRTPGGAGANFAGLVYFLPLLLLAWFGAAGRRVPARARALAVALVAAAFASGALHGSPIEARVLATPFLVALAAWGWPELRARLAPVSAAGAGGAPGLAALAAFQLGAGLFAVTAAGLLVPLRNPEVYLEPAASGWSRLEYSEAQVYGAAEVPVTDRREFAARLTHVVHGGLQHYWSDAGADRYALRVPFHENWLLHALSWFDPSRFRLYEFVDYRRALARGVGLCSQHAIVETGLLQQRGIPARVVRLGGHVVLEARVDDAAEEWWLLDPDFGVVMPFSLARAQRDLDFVRRAYIAAGYSAGDAVTISEYYGADANMQFRDADAYAGRLRAAAERGAYLGIWLLPLLLMTPFALASLRGASDTAAEA